MEEIYERTLLYDFYGELLTPHRREIYSAVVFDDMSLSEAAEAFGVSRQGIHDVVKKCDEALREYEDKLHLGAQFRKQRSLLENLGKEVREAGDIPKERREELLRSLSELQEAVG
ncbi:MAG: DNA-binding protein [Lachnospiraceae bacterium]|nr:DNA-binding protein [Lachnospiraceae bacterium]